MDQRLQKLMQELGEAINESLSDSDQIAEVIAKIKTGGYDVFLVLEATIGFSRTEERGPAAPPAFEVRLEKAEPAPLKMTPLDKKFLRSLKITVEDEE